MWASVTVGLALTGSAHGYDMNEPFRFAIQMHHTAMALQFYDWLLESGTDGFCLSGVISRPEGLCLYTASMPGTPLTLCTGLHKSRPEGLDSYRIESYLSDNSVCASDTVGLALTGSAHG